MAKTEIDRTLAYGEGDVLSTLGIDHPIPRPVVVSQEIKDYEAHMASSDPNEPARCLVCDWSGSRDKYAGDTAPCPDCGNGTTRHASPSVREDGRGKGKVAAAFSEVYSKVPKTVKATGKTGVAKRKMMTAIALSKARAAGAKV
jgi:hypothetical protein